MGRVRMGNGYRRELLTEGDKIRCVRESKKWGIQRRHEKWQKTSHRKVMDNEYAQEGGRLEGRKMIQAKVRKTGMRTEERKHRKTGITGKWFGETNTKRRRPQFRRYCSHEVYFIGMLDRIKTHFRQSGQLYWKKSRVTTAVLPIAQELEHT